MAEKNRLSGKKTSFNGPFLLIAGMLAMFSFLFSGCMMAGMGMGKGFMSSDRARTTGTIRQVNTGDVPEWAIREIVADLSSRALPVKSLAVWEIKSRTAGLDVETIRLKLMSRLVEAGTFDVIDRDRLTQLLEEKKLALSGILDEQSAGEIGRLIGVDGFIDGFVSLKDDRFLLSLNLIETKSGKILWSKIVEDRVDR